MPSAPQHPGLRESPVGSQFVGYCVLRKKELRTARNGRVYLLLELGDFSGRLRARIWEKSEQVYRQFQVGQVIKVKGIVQDYEGFRELKVLRIRKLAEKETVALEQLLPASDRDVAALQSRFYEHMASITNGHLKQLLEKIFSDQAFEQSFLQAPAGTLWHHRYLYGLLEHVVCLLDLADTLAVHYPRINLDLLKCGIILHDVGKVWEFQQVRGFLEYSDEGRLLGHVVLGYWKVQQILQTMDSFPEALAQQLLHMLLSHPGSAEQGAPVLPMTLEAAVLAALNQVDVTANAFCRILQYDVEPNSNWSKFNPLLERFVYVGQKPDQDPAKDQEHQV